jgi:hypothetical protein
VTALAVLAVLVDLVVVVLAVGASLLLVGLVGLVGGAPVHPQGLDAPLKPPRLLPGTTSKQSRVERDSRSSSALT